MPKNIFIPMYWEKTKSEYYNLIVMYNCTRMKNNNLIKDKDFLSRKFESDINRLIIVFLLLFNIHWISMGKMLIIKKRHYKEPCLLIVLLLNEWMIGDNRTRSVPRSKPGGSQQTVSTTYWMNWSWLFTICRQLVDWRPTNRR